MDKFREYLQSISSIKDKEFADTITYFTERQLNRGDFFVQQDKVCRQVGFILNGMIRIYYTARRQVLCISTPLNDLDLTKSSIY
jgi:hypothetical protein